ncbi:MAG: CHAP domain-containing protein [Novosphingobium sp.]
MRAQLLAGGLVLVLACSAPALASGAIGWDDDPRSGSARGSGYLQCVPYARQVSGIQLFGDAHTWWAQAAGQYERGSRPRVGAVMAFRPYGNMRLGHVAAVSRIIDSRTVLIRHANWSPIDGRRGQIEDNVQAVDVSPGNDWSEVRVWFDPIQALGGTRWPLNGFIYNKAPQRRLDEGMVLAKASKREPEARVQLAANARQPVRRQSAAAGDQESTSHAPRGRSADPIGEIIAARANRAPGNRTLALRD